MTGRAAAFVVVILLLSAAASSVAAGASASVTEPGVVYAEGTRLMLDGEPFVMRGFNYLPRDYGWTSMTDWDWAEVDAELALAREYGANTVRTGFEYSLLTGDRGCRHPLTQYEARPEYLDAADRFLTIAAAHGLKVVFWLGAGPCWGALWDPANSAVIARHLESLIPRFAGDPRIAAWDLATDLDGTMLQPPPAGAYGSDPRATRDNMVALLAGMAATVRRLDPGHLLTVGFCWASSSLLAQDFTDFLMPQFLGGDAPNVLSADEAARVEDYGAWAGYAADPEGALAQLAAVISTLREGLRRPMPIVLAEFGSPTQGVGYSEAYQQAVYAAVLEMAFLRADLAGALNWVLTDFTWPPLADTFLSGTLSVEEQSFGILDAAYRPKPAAAVARAYFTGRAEISLQSVRAELAFVFDRSFVPAETDPASDDRRRLTAAFDWVEFRDGAGRSLRHLEIGDPAAREYLRAGFYDDEGPWGQEAANFAWAGGADRTARLAAGFPERVRTVAFRALVNQATAAEVLVDGLRTGTVELTPGWRVYTVSLPEEGVPTVGEARPVRGSLDVPVGDGAVTLQVAYAGGAWEDAAVVTPEGGRFEAALSFTRGGPVRLRAAWSGDEWFGPAVSVPVVLEVAPAAASIEISELPDSAAAGAAGIISGRFLPEAAGVALVLTLTRPDGTEFAQQATTGAGGGFEVAVVPDAPGPWSVRAFWEGSADYLAAEARASFTVIPAPASTTAAATTAVPTSAGGPGDGETAGGGIALYAGLAAAAIVAAAAMALATVRRRRQRLAARADRSPGA